VMSPEIGHGLWMLAVGGPTAVSISAARACRLPRQARPGFVKPPEPFCPGDGSVTLVVDVLILG